MCFTAPFEFHQTKDAPCNIDACPWNCPCLGEARGCPVDGRHEKNYTGANGKARSCGACTNEYH